jgi:hypothetical protein
MTTPVQGPTIMLRSGNYFSLQTPEQSVFTIEDIAHALAHICRYTGHCSSHYSVAQHAVLVSHVVPIEHAFAGLMHDAAEAFIGDVAKPLKDMLPDYRHIEERIEAAVFARFGLPPTMPPSVKAADRVLLRTEQRDLMGANGHVWTYTADIQPLPERIHPWPAPAARQIFLDRFRELYTPTHPEATP